MFLLLNKERGDENQKFNVAVLSCYFKNIACRLFKSDCQTRIQPYPHAKNKNKDGSLDLGIMQINSKTFNAIKKEYPTLSENDLRAPRKT
ncbi:hypothetical protein CBG25_09890 [Arsenophonus sp. ENCA]|uniref:transglycosylase SLT domain-containing protein n=1 Tax=Arsenophonus sp. ENCA TaxID=1987579 RepID=UPI000BC70BBD|nr:transglycosylase SLT domain-containing protein [Arsenophonus sp. ENCA]PAV01953.1 hypothetical protein CBG25_13720 [Arsenophonus sp. ENCA]PAV02604.1 hypothetical protein CBG25_09890 [Arsenophonus sp. ENCA]